ncbi:MAG: 4'-phosphopantetheinyl transferase family protein [Treponemataceae bacterium]
MKNIECTHIFYANTENLKNNDTFSFYYKKLPQFRKEKSDSYKLQEDKIRSVAAWSLLCKAFPLVDTEFSENTIAFEASCSEHGKPQSKNYPLHFNLSHSGNFVLCAISENPVGCDVEKIKKSNIKFAERFFHPQEVNHLKSFSKGKSSLLNTEFYKIWVLKESLLKAKGTGLTVALKSFSVIDRINIIDKIDIIDEMENKNFNLFYLNFLETSGYAAAAATMDSKIKLQKIILD